MPPKKTSAQTKTKTKPNNKKAPVTKKPASKPSAKVAPKSSAKVAPKPSAKSGKGKDKVKAKDKDKVKDKDKEKRDRRKLQKKLFLGMAGVNLLFVGAATASYLTYKKIQKYTISKKLREKFEGQDNAIEKVLENYVKNEEPTKQCRGDVPICMAALPSLLEMQNKVDKNMHILGRDIKIEPARFFGLHIEDYSVVLSEVVNSNAKIILGFISLFPYGGNDGHANVITIIFPRNGANVIVERFDPNGITYDRSVEDAINRVLDGFAKDIGKEKGLRYVYKNLYETVSCPRFPQSRVTSHTDIMCNGDGGFCVVFSTLYIYLRALYPDNEPWDIINGLYIIDSAKLHDIILKFYNKIEVVGWLIFRETQILKYYDSVVQSKNVVTRYNLKNGVLKEILNNVNTFKWMVDDMFKRNCHIEKRLVGDDKNSAARKQFNSKVEEVVELIQALYLNL